MSIVGLERYILTSGSSHMAIDSVVPSEQQSFINLLLILV